MSLPDRLPPKMAGLPIDKHGRPVPWFVAPWYDTDPDFRVMDGRKLEDAHRFNLCWVCGTHRGRNVTFVIGPMCAVNRISAEPPSHLDCALYSAVHCPFLSRPEMVRRSGEKPVGSYPPPGEMIARNPGVTLLWTTRDYRPIQVGTGYLFELGDPTQVQWFCQGRPATREEVLASITSGMPLLEHAAAREGAGALAELGQLHDAALELVPA